MVKEVAVFGGVDKHVDRLVSVLTDILNELKSINEKLSQIKSSQALRK